MSTLSEREKVMHWMPNQHASDAVKICTNAILHFSSTFRFTDHQERLSCMRKANRWSREAKRTLDSSPSLAIANMRPCRSRGKKECLVSTGRNDGIVKRGYLKAKRGMGRKKQQWVIELEGELFEDFLQARWAEIKFHREVVREMAIRIIEQAPEVCSYNHRERDALSNKSILSHVNSAFLARFCEIHDIVQRSQEGKLMCSEKKKAEIELAVASHLAHFKRKFTTKEYDKNCMSIMDETCLKIDMNSGKTLDFEGASHVSYVETASRSDSFALMLHATGGRGGTIEPGFIIFRNEKCSYPIRNVPADVPGISYRTGKIGWMDERIFPEMLKEKNFFRPLPGGKTRVLFLDNVRSHNFSDAIDDALAKANTKICFFPLNSTHLTQPCDAFVIAVFKQCWRALWDSQKADDIMRGLLRDGKGRSGKLENPGKH